jgi:hypothetical protein
MGEQVFTVLKKPAYLQDELDIIDNLNLGLSISVNYPENPDLTFELFPSSTSTSLKASVDPGFNVVFISGPNGNRTATVSGIKFSILNTSILPRDINALFVTITGISPVVKNSASFAILNNNMQLWYYPPLLPPVQVTCFNLVSVLQPPNASYNWTLFYDFVGCPGGNKWTIAPGGSLVLMPANAAARSKNFYVTYR